MNNIGAIIDDPMLQIVAATLDDLEKNRIAVDNRLRILTQAKDKLDEDGIARGFGLSEDHPAVAKVADIADGVYAAEQQAILLLQKTMRQHPIWIAWGSKKKGIGEKTVARLLSTIGDPYWNTAFQRPRTVSELWAYCGLHVVNGASARRSKGVQSNWSDEARKRIWLITTKAIMAKGPYYDLYQDARAKYLDATHLKDCVRCGPSGKPALAGSPLSDGHKHARGIRIVAKTILKELWIESRTIHKAQAEKAA
jgi:hypothetical protein